MTLKNFILKSRQGAELFAYQWLPEDEPKGIVLISHGMVETAERYTRLALRLTDSGYAVYAIDHLGHGRTAKREEDIGVLSKDDFPKMVGTLEDLRLRSVTDYPDRKTYLLGHSMGSFLAQRYIQIYGEHLSGVILSGTAGKAKGAHLLKLFVDTLTLIRGKARRAKILDLIQFGGYNKHFRPNRTSFDWLSRDAKEVDAYIDHPHCGLVVNYGFFQCLINGTLKLHQKKRMLQVPRELPIFIFGGTEDPVGAFTATVRWLAAEYRRIGIQDVKEKYYKGGRHEMLNEINRDEVERSILDWLDDKNSL